MLLKILKAKKLSQPFTKKNSKKKKKKKKKNQKEFRLEKVIKRKGDKLGVKWKAHFSSFNSCIDKKRHSINE